MKNENLLLVFFILFLDLNLWGQKEQIVKVACIGNSITYGSGIKKREKNAYPPQLGKMLGKAYEVRNYGFSGRTMLSKGDHPYMAEKMFFEAISWKPDMVIIMLGTNDSKPQNWKFKAKFETDYNKLITAFDTLSSKPKIYLIKVVPVFKTRWGINDSVVYNELNPLIEKIANQNKLPLIDLYTPLLGKGNLFPDDIHPNTEGSAEMAKVIYDVIFKDANNQLGEKTSLHSQDKQKFGINSSNYHDLRGGLKNSFIKFDRKKKARVAFLGGSITYNGGWRDSLMQYIQKRFPETEFEFIVAGIPSFGSTEDVFRLERDVLSKGNIDLLFVEAAVNDGGKGRSPEEIKRSMEGIVRNVRNVNPASDIVFMYFVDPAKIEDYRKGKTPQIIQYHDEVAKYYDIPAINLAKEVTHRIDVGEFTWKDNFKNLHPPPFGQGVYARSIISFLNNTWSGFVADDDKITDYPMPGKLDKACYDNGILIPAKEVKPVKGWEFIKNWDPKDRIWTRDNYVKVPMLVGKYPGKTLKFSFKGNAVGIAVAAGPDAGIIEYRIDGDNWKTRDLFTKHSTHYHLPWYYTLADGLASKKHLLELRLTDKKNEKSKGSVVRIRYFYVNDY